MNATEWQAVITIIKLLLFDSIINFSKNIKWQVLKFPTWRQEIFLKTNQSINQSINQSKHICIAPCVTSESEAQDQGQVYFLSKRPLETKTREDYKTEKFSS